MTTKGLMTICGSSLFSSVAALLLTGGVAFAQDQTVAPLGPDDSAPYAFDRGTYRGIPWISGGVGKEERDYLIENFADAYNLKLEFARTDGAYMGDISVVISQQGGGIVIAAGSSGPWFMVELPAGTYGIEASGDGQRFERTVDVPATGLETVVFAGWDDEPAVK